MAKNYFDNCRTIEELKVTYKKLVRIHHPDNGGSMSEMQEINSQYDTAFNRMKSAHNAKSENKSNQNTEQPEEFRQIIEALMRLEGIVIEVCGSWLWLSSNTYPHCETLRKMGFKFANKNKMWYMGEMKRKNGRSMSMDVIRSKYGSDVYESEPVLRLS